MSLTNSISISSSTFALRARFAHILLMTHKKYVPAPSEITTMKKSRPPSILCSYEMPPLDEPTSSESRRAKLEAAPNVAPSLFSIACAEGGAPDLAPTVGGRGRGTLS